MIGLPIK